MNERMVNEQNLKFIFGLKLNQLRQQAGISLKDLSDRTGISPSYLNEIEKGKKYPKPDKIMKLSQALDTPYDDMVSLKLEDDLHSLTDILKDGTLQEIPFELFGLETADIMELMSGSPMKFSALIDTFIKIARNYDMRVEHLLFAALRSYQEMNNNYFEDIEKKAEQFISSNPQINTKKVYLSDVRACLERLYSYEVIEEEFVEEDGLSGVRSVFVPGKTPKIILNQNLTDSQKSFILAKEIGYQYMDLKARDNTAALLHAPTFEVLLNNFKSSYFAGALLIKRDLIIEDMRTFFRMEEWDSKAFLKIINGFNATPEMFYHRLTQILPAFFEIDQLYFLRFHHHLPTNHYKLTKELHFSRLHQPHGIGLHEHYCRRWITLILLKQLEENHKKGKKGWPIIAAQKSRFFKTDNEYLCLSIARPLMLTKNTDSCVTIGFVMSEKFKRKVRFWNDPNIESLIVNKTCERCGIPECNERVAPPIIFEKEKREQQARNALEKIKEKYE